MPKDAKTAAASPGPPLTRTPPESDPLNAEQAKSLLTSVSVIRDPLHGDIRITALERCLIDTETFQRLKHINQLAMVDTVYPGATHNRFLHSLGVLHVCSEMVVACNNSTKAARTLAAADHPIPVKIGPYAELLVRLVALLHDLAHVSFGHVFEREAQVFAYDEWEDPWRVERTLGAKSDLTEAFERYFLNYFGSLPDATLRLSAADARRAAAAVITDVLSVLKAKRKEVIKLQYPFVYDMVSNTICADLIDYVQRDMLFCGLTERLGLRFMKYLALIPVRWDGRALNDPGFCLRPYRSDAEYAGRTTEVDGKMEGVKLILLQYSYNERHSIAPKSNILAEAIDLVRRRKMVAEKLYFHKTKLVATSMLAAAAHASGIESAERIWGLSDREVLKHIANTEGAGRQAIRARKLASKLMKRHLFKPIYRASYHPDTEDYIPQLLWHRATGAYRLFNNPSGRHQLIDKLEEYVGIKLGDAERGVGCVSISCPNRDMQLKGFEMLVLPGPTTAELRPLQATVRPIVKREIEVIQEGHKELWKLEVFVDPRIVDLDTQLARDLAAAIQSAMRGIPNEVDEFKEIAPEPIEQLLHRAKIDAQLRSLGMVDVIKKMHYDELVSGQVAAKDRPETVAAQLKDWGYALDEPAKE